MDRRVRRPGRLVSAPIGNRNRTTKTGENRSDKGRKLVNQCEVIFILGNSSTRVVGFVVYSHV